MKANKKKLYKTKYKDNTLLISGYSLKIKDLIPSLIHISRYLQEDIDKYCRGNRDAIINILLRMGLNTLIDNNELVEFDSKTDTLIAK